MKIFDSTKKQKLDFIPIKSNEARIYVCGPTLYDDAHLGHARSAISFDILRRILKANGLKVILAKNFTDIDDKIIAKSHECGESIEYITNKYLDSYLRDMEALGVMRADIEPKATQNLESMFKIIENLLAKNLAYKAKNGDIYMRVKYDENYGALSNRANLEEQISRIGENENKEDIRDFALWKNNSNEFGYDSPFGFGRPGWHLECSAMIEAHLAYKNEEFSIDIHGGGADLLFPHHENEACQSRLANEKELAKYWMHNGFVNINGEKMSKSLGNSFFVKDALKIYDGEVLRYYLLQMHYRAPLNFNHYDLLQAKKRLDRIYRFKKRVGNEIDSSKDCDKDFKNAFLGALNDDINISIALSALDSMLSNYNDLMDKSPKDSTLKAKARANLALISELLGIGLKNAQDYFHLGASEELKKEIEQKIIERNEAKKAKNYQKSDEIRDYLKAKNVSLQDTKDGVIWEYLENYDEI